MTRDEFNNWWQTFKAAYPEAADQIAKSEDAGRATLLLWFEAFDDVTFDDATEVVKKMVRGDLPTIRNYERGETAAIIRRHAREIAFQRTTKPEEAPWRNHTRRLERGVHIGTASSVMNEPVMRAALEAYLRMEKEGASKAELRAMLEKRFPPEKNPRRYSCRLCLDSGLVHVWSEKSIRACLDKTLDDRANRRQATIPCECERGRVKVSIKSKDTGREYWTRHFDPRHDCQCIDVDDQASILALEKWCDEKLTEKPANYTAAFDDWNAHNAQGEF